MTTAPASLGLFERGLSLWVGLAIVAGLALGQRFTSAFSWLAGL
jgi:ACR3 family arsenite transporter